MPGILSTQQKTLSHMSAHVADADGSSEMSAPMRPGMARHHTNPIFLLTLHMGMTQNKHHAAAPSHRGMRLRIAPRGPSVRATKSIHHLSALFDGTVKASVHLGKLKSASQGKQATVLPAWPSGTLQASDYSKRGGTSVRRTTRVLTLIGHCSLTRGVS